MILPVRPNSGSSEKLSESIRTMAALHGAQWMFEYAFYHHDRLALDFEWAVENFPANASVLEIGGYPFFLTHALRAQGYELECIDKLIPEARRLADAASIPVTSCDIELEPLPYADDTFDEVLLNEVFEHLRINPISTTEEIHRVLKPGGRVWISTPNLGSLKGIANLVFRNEAWAVVGEGVYAQYQGLRENGVMGHVREYTSSELRDFLKHVGFEVAAIVYRGGYSNVVAEQSARLFPRLRPYFSCIARKPNGH